MNSGLDINDHTVVTAFRAALVHQALIALAIFAALALAWLAARTIWPGGRSGHSGEAGGAALAAREPAGRKLLVIGFGNLWLFDGILQAQPKMALGLPSRVIEPAAASSPAWVQHLVNWAGTAWTYHPMQAGAAAVWIQVGLGIWLLAAPHGALSRLAGLASAGWGLIVWVFGEAFGGVLAPGLSWLTGAPGAAALYVVAGLLIALPDRWWRSPRAGRLMTAALGVFVLAMAVLQAWPGRGYWSGISHGRLGTLAAMPAAMALMPQPAALATWVSAFAAFDVAHGFAVNLFAVTVLAAAGAGFLTGRARLVRPALIALAVLGLADWVLVQDLGFLGGLGTDPNSMIPFLLLAASGWLTLARPAPAEVPQAAAPAPDRRPVAVRIGAASAWSVAALGGACLIVLGAVPLAAAQADRNADPILAESIAGSPAPVDIAAPGFSLTDQHGATVTLTSLRGKVVLLSFVDPACAASCPPVEAEFRRTAELLGPSARQVEFVAIAASAAHHSEADVAAFDRRASLRQVPDWLFLTGSGASLRRVWRAYHVTPLAGRGGGQVFLIDRQGNIRQEYLAGRGPVTAATTSSFAVLFTNAAREALSTGNH